MAALQPQPASRLVWALPISLAATYGISFDFFSTGYLDVSVHLVPSSYPMCSDMGDGVLLRRVPPFGNLGITVLVQLPRAFRRLRVLLRQLVPRHSSRTLLSLFTQLLLSARCARISMRFSKFSASRLFVSAFRLRFLSARLSR